MIFLRAFIFSSLVCGIGQAILEFTKLQPGDLNTSLAILGVLLSFFGFYDPLVKFCGAGATILIMNYGHLVFTKAYNGFLSKGLLGLMTGLFEPCCCLSIAIISAFFITLFFKPKH